MVPAPFIVVVDANVLFPLTLRDTVLRAAAAGFYQGFVAMLREQAADLVKPPVTFDELLERLGRVVPDLVAAVRQHGQAAGTR